jgi:hypothetical protein
MDSSSRRRYWAFAFFGLALAICAFLVFFHSSTSRNSASSFAARR